jgi:hypothetical protein
MVEREGGLQCSARGAELSEHARSQLAAIVDGHASTAKRHPDQPFRWGVSWFCPADAHPLNEVDGVLECNDCGRAITGGLVHELIELNVH